MIEDISSKRVQQANALIKAYHEKAEAALELVTPVVQSSEKLVEIEEKMESYEKVKIVEGQIVVPEIMTPPNEAKEEIKYSKEA